MPKVNNQATDSVYLLKIVLFFILGALWLDLSRYGLGINAFPIGLLVGLGFASHDHFQIDRKIEYAVLIVAAIISYFAPTGIVLAV